MHPVGVVATETQHHSWCAALAVVLNSEALVTNIFEGEENVRTLKTRPYLDGQGAGEHEM